MSIADVAASAVKAISKYSAKKLSKKGSAPEIAKHNIYNFSAEKYNVGFASCEVMPDINKNYWSLTLSLKISWMLFHSIFPILSKSHQ